MRYKTSDVFFSLSLLTLFVICSAMVLLYQIQGYQRILQRNESSEAHHLSLAYLHERLLHLEEGETYTIVHREGIDVLKIENDQLATCSYLYAYNGFLRELHVVKEADISLAQGDQLIALDQMRMEESEHYMIITCILDGEQQELQLWKRIS